MSEVFCSLYGKNPGILAVKIVTFVMLYCIWLFGFEFVDFSVTQGETRAPVSCSPRPGAFPESARPFPSRGEVTRSASEPASRGTTMKFGRPGNLSAPWRPSAPVKTATKRKKKVTPLSRLSMPYPPYRFCAQLRL